MPSGREGEGGKEFSTADMQSPTGVMTRADLAELVARGESSSLEFRRDDLTAECLASEMAGLYMDYATREDRTHGGPMTPRLASDGEVMEPGLVERAIEFVRRNTMPTARLENGRVIRGWEYPEAVVREAVMNALVHRDYSIAGSDIELLVFSNRLEVRSPGGLPNTVTPEAMRRGMRYARDQVLVNVMRDYGYVDGHGMGISRKIVPGMRKHNGTEPELIEEGERFTVRLRKEPPALLTRS